VLAEGRLVPRPDAASARFEGTLTLTHEEFFEEKQIIKLVAGGRYELYSKYPLQIRAVVSSVDGTAEFEGCRSQARRALKPEQT
jgi:hypothetical protein